MVKVGSLIKLEYSASVDGKVIEKPKGALVVAVGKNHVLPGLDEALQKTEVGKESEVVIPPAKAYGERNADLVRLVPLELFKKQGVEPVQGMIFELDNMPCRVQSVSGGRVRVDFNHEFAGKTISYKFKIIEDLTTVSAKVSAIGQQFFGEKAKVVYDETAKVATFTVDSDACLKQGYIAEKGRAIAMVFTFIDEVKSVKFNEEFQKAKMQQTD
ncbi:MAG: peptidylprolyl isomerase [Candidatus Micrarchaeota archaeon]